MAYIYRVRNSFLVQMTAIKFVGRLRKFNYNKRMGLNVNCSHLRF